MQTGATEYESGMDRPVRDMLLNRVVAFMLDEYFADVDPASSIYDLTVRELVQEVQARKAARR